MAIAKGQWLAWSILYTIETVAAFLAGSHMYASRKPGPARIILLLCVSLAFRSAWCYEHEGTQDETWYGTAAGIAHALLVCQHHRRHEPHPRPLKRLLLHARPLVAHHMAVASAPPLHHTCTKGRTIRAQSPKSRH